MRPREGAEERGDVPWLCEAGQIALVIVLAVYVINVGYGFEGTGARLDELHDLDFQQIQGGQQITILD